MSLELELWAMNSARISALEAGGGGGGSTSDLCVKIPKFEWPYAAEHTDDIIFVELEEENPFGGWYTDFTVPDDGKPHYAIIGCNVGFGIQSSLIFMESSGGELLDGDELSISEMVRDEEENSTAFYSIFSNSLNSSHQTIFYDPEREDAQAKSYSIAYDGDTYIRPILLKNGVSYRIAYDIGFTPDFDNPEMESAFEETREFIATATRMMIVPGFYEEIPVVVRNGGNA